MTAQIATLLRTQKSTTLSFSNSYVDCLKFLKVSGSESEYTSIDRLLRHLGRKTGSKGTKRAYLKRIYFFCLYLNMNPDEIIALPKHQIEEFVQTYADGYHDDAHSPAYINNSVLAPVRSAIIALHPFCHKEIDFHKLFADQKINQAIKDAYDYCEWVKKIKYKARRIETTAQGVTEDIKQLDMQLKQALQELQVRIHNAVTQIENVEEHVVRS